MSTRDDPDIEAEVTAALLHELRGPVASFESEAQAAVAIALQALRQQTGDNIAYTKAAQECLARLEEMSHYGKQIRRVLDSALARVRSNPFSLRRTEADLLKLIDAAASTSLTTSPARVVVKPRISAAQLISCDPALVTTALKLSIQAFDDVRRDPIVRITWSQLGDTIRIRLVGHPRSRESARGSSTRLPRWLDEMLVRRILEAHGGTFSSDRDPLPRDGPGPKWIEFTLPIRA
jgi:signal transduction histidine kinase